MTSNRHPGSRSERERAGDPESPSTLRSVEVAEAADATSPDHDLAGLPVYYEPQPLVAISNHKTIEVETIKLADDIDPRKLPTELRLARPSVMPPDSGGPQTDVVVVSSQPPLAARHRWRIPVVLCALLGALLLLVLARSAGQHSYAAQVAPPAPSEVMALPSPSPTLTAPADSAALPPSAPEPAPSATATAEPHTEKRAASGHASPKPSSHRNTDPTPSASARALTTPGASKPKRAIY